MGLRFTILYNFKEFVPWQFVWDKSGVPLFSGVGVPGISRNDQLSCRTNSLVKKQRNKTVRVDSCTPSGLLFRWSQRRRLDNLETFHRKAGEPNGFVSAKSRSLVGFQESA